MNIEARHGTLLRRWAAAAALAGLSLGAQAGTLSKATTGVGATATGNAVKITGPVTGGGWSTTPGATPYTAGNIGFSSDGTIVWGQGSTKMPLPGGRNADLNVRMNIPRTGGIKAIAKIGINLLPYGGTALAIAGYLEGLGVVFRDGAPVEVSPAQEYATNSYPSTWFGTRAGAWQYALDQGNVYWSGVGNTCPAGSGVRVVSWWSNFSPDNQDNGYNVSQCGGTGVFNSGTISMLYREANGGVTTEKALTLQELENKIAAHSGWPTTRTAALAEAVRLGESVEADAPTVTGPASVTGPTTQKTVTGPSGNTVTNTTTTYNITYQGDTITVNESRTSITTNPDGSSTTETETSEPPAEEPEEEKNEFDTPSEEIPKRTETLTYAQDNLGFGGGSCPGAFGWSDSLGSHTVDLAPLCDKVTSIVRPLVLMFATVLAIFIVVPGIKQE